MKRNYLPLLIAGGVGIAFGSFVTGSVTSLLPLALILACPFMMIYMMGSMGTVRQAADHDDVVRHERREDPRRTQQRG